MKHSAYFRLLGFAGSWLPILAMLLISPSVYFQEGAVNGSVAVERLPAKKRSAPAPVQANGDVVVWLSPLNPDSTVSESKRSKGPLQVIQRNKSFEPHLLVVQVGSVVQFPNKDLEKLQREVLISDSTRSLESIHVVESAAPATAHKNKYGKDYVPPSSSAYSNP